MKNKVFKNCRFLFPKNSQQICKNYQFFSNCLSYVVQQRNDNPMKD